jgi:hypothetical protein
MGESELPSNVARFEQLMYLSLVIEFIDSALAWDHNVAMASKLGGAYFVLFVEMCVFAFWMLFIWLIARRRKNWARWIILVSFVAATPMSVPLIREWLRFEPVVGVLSLVQGLAQVIALVLVFTGNARDWFKTTPALVQS